MLVGPEPPSPVELRDPEGLARELRSARACIAELETALERSHQRSNALVMQAEVTNLLLEEVFNASRDAIWVLDREFRVVRANRQMARLVGREPQDLVGRRCSEVARTSVCGTAACVLGRLLEKGQPSSVHQDVEAVFGSGGPSSCILSASICRDPCAEVLGVVETFTDITARKEAELALDRANQALALLSRIDALTGLANRRSFDEVLESEWKRHRRDGRPLSLFLGDIDFFKRYNDSHGHQAGDQCLTAVAQAVREALKRPADLAARYGGEEFVVVLPATPAEGARHVAELARARVEGLRLAHGASAVADHVTLSIGVATLVPGSGSPAVLTRLADLALYRAKAEGRNRVVAHADTAKPGGDEVGIPSR